jgi:Cu-Zn family superoxide dismutase
MLAQAALSFTAAGGGRAGLATFRDTPQGMLVEVQAKGLSPGLHGMHFHERDDCAAGYSEADKRVIPAGAAGPHYDPAGTKAHRGPLGGGHRGDLPRIRADRRGVARARFVMPQITVSEVVGRSLILHAGGDNFSDVPKPNGGAGERQICGPVRAVVAGSRYPGAMSTRKFSADRVEHTRRVENRHYLCVAHDTERAAIQPIRLVAGLIGGPLVGYAAWSLRRERPVLATSLGVVAASMSAWSLYVFTKAEIEMRKGEGR